MQGSWIWSAYDIFYWLLKIYDSDLIREIYLFYFFSVFWLVVWLSCNHGEELGRKPKTVPREKKEGGRRIPETWESEGEEVLQKNCRTPWDRSGRSPTPGPCVNAPPAGAKERCGDDAKSAETERCHPPTTPTIHLRQPGNSFFQIYLIPYASETTIGHLHPWMTLILEIKFSLNVSVSTIRCDYLWGYCRCRILIY